MSFPPRPPPIIQMPPMPPMMPNPYGYGPQMNMGMPPMNMPPMGMNPMMRGPPPNYGMMNMNMNSSVNSLKAALSLPITKVFVGNISDRVPDPMMRAMLQRCGNVMNWKRVEGPSGKLQAFGFCEYDNPQSTLRCIRLLNGYEIAEKKLLVKVDQKTRELLGEYIKKKDDKAPLTKNAKKAAMLRNYPSSNNRNRSAEDGELDEDESNNEKNINLELVDEDTLKEDRIVLNALEMILRQYQKDLVPAPPPQPAPSTTEAIIPTSTPPLSTTANLTTTTTTTTSTAVAIKPANSDAKVSTPLSVSSNESKDNKLKEIDNDLNSRTMDTKSRDRDRDRDTRDRDRDRDRDRERDRKPRDYSPVNNIDAKYRGRNNSRSPERDLSKPAKSTSYKDSRSRTRSRSPTDHSRRARKNSAERTSSSSYRDESRTNKNSSPPPAAGGRFSRNNTSDLSQKENSQKPATILSAEEQDEERERKKLERRLREKESAYRERLKQWEERENKKRRQYMAEKKTEMQKRKLLLKEAKKLRQFMEDFEDDKDDSNFYKGSNLEKKLKAREKEIEADNRDRQREKEELEELKKKLSEKGFADVENEAKKIHENEHNRMKTKFEKLEQSSSSSSSSSEDDEEEFHATDENNQEKLVSLQYFNKTSQVISSSHSQELSYEKMPIENEKTQHNVTDYMAEQNEDSNSMLNKPDELADLNSINITSNNKNSNILSDGDSSSPFINSATYNDSPAQNLSTKIEINSLSSPSSNSPLYLNSGSSVNTNNHFLPASTATHVTIKTFTKKSIQPVIKAFADEEDDMNGPQFKRAKLVSLSDQSNESKMNSDERKKAVKKLVESIPTDRDELFSYAIDWTQLDESLMDKRIKPWINKKIIEYIGEEEATLNDFICTKIQQHTKPEKLLEEVKVILDDEAELFIKKMWRLIVYETESKRQGLSK